ncbi:META domain-containing protein [Devosia sediminis]|uniref:META domain-containing protein n=1 Tax=Devosia sediminis TaxID=2798801 RepID=A0A934IVY8_9HYPH|nr:META domain-containing protein [Devosia sediminis]MBJ3783312.1 META domain-containing protein [Devosia sediminis]
MSMSKLVSALLALLLILTTPALAQPVILDGTVTYRERIALPPDAWLRVMLVELTDGRPIVGATAGIPAKGEVPIAFVLNVRSDVDAHDGTHGLVAEISSGGRVLFRNPVPVPVAAPGNLTHIVANYAPGPIVDPKPPEEPDEPMLPDPLLPPQPGLLDTVWTVTSIGGKPAIADSKPTLSIAADHRAGGTGGCNNFFTEATVSGDSISFGPAAATMMACGQEIMDQEHAYFLALEAVASYHLDAQGLRLLDAAGIPLIGLVSATE